MQDADICPDCETGRLLESQYSPTLICRVCGARFETDNIEE